MAKKQNRISELKIMLGTRQAYELLESEGQGLYEEIDKLAKRAPSELVTSLQLKIVNSFITKCKNLLNGDTIIDEMSVFVSAGDNPEYRDVLTVLRQIIQGLERFKEYQGRYLWEDDFVDELQENDIDEEAAIPLFNTKHST